MAERTAKLHELLAAVGTAKGQADATRTDLKKTFHDKRHLFGEAVRTFQPNTENAERVTEEQSSLQSTVRKELGWIAGILARAIDAAYQVEESNMHARGDVILDDGTVLLTNIPATYLLQLEKRVGEIHELVAAIPTLDPAKGYEPDPARGVGIYRAREVVKQRTKKVPRSFVKYEATEHHPAQTELIHEDVVIGTVREQEWSGLITPSEKAEILERVEDLRRAVQTGRSRANEADASKLTIGKTIFTYLFKA